MKNITIITVTILLSVLSLISDVYSKEWDRLLNLKGQWKFTIGDDKKWSEPGFNDNSWEDIRVPSSWEDEGFNGYNGYAWYRKHFNCPSAAKNRVVYLFLGYIDDVDEVYLNGTKIGFSGSFPPDYETAYNALRRYPVPSGLLKINGENVISIRVYDSQLAGGIVSGDIGLYTSDRLMQLDVNLEGLWKFKTGNKNEWKEKDFKDNDWGSIIVPGFWETQGYQDYDGFAWYRRDFTIGNNLSNKKLVLVMGKIDDIDEVYVNGKLVGSTGEMKDDAFEIHFDNEYSQFRGYYLPDNVLQFGKTNTIAVKVFDGYISGGIYQGPIGIISQDKYARFWRQQKKDKNFLELFFGD